MTMTSRQVQKHVMDYLEATECQIIEKSPYHVTVKLSPRADQMLTDRPYYWGFVERTGAEPQTLSFTFVFDPEKYDAATPSASQGSPGLGMSGAARPGNPAAPGGTAGPNGAAAMGVGGATGASAGVTPMPNNAAGSGVTPFPGGAPMGQTSLPGNVAATGGAGGDPLPRNAAGAGGSPLPGNAAAGAASLPGNATTTGSAATGLSALAGGPALGSAGGGPRTGGAYPGGNGAGPGPAADNAPPANAGEAGGPFAAGASPQATADNGGGAPNGPNDGILARYFGVAPVLPRLGPGLIRREDIAYGSRRLRQIWAAAQTEGKCLYLFEAPGNLQRMTLFSAAYEPWLAVCFKVELSCDLKREELHFIGVSLLTGEVREDFGTGLESIPLTPRLPENIHIQPYEITLSSGAELLERHILSKLSVQDYGWAEAARRRLQAELEIIDAYYGELLKEPDETKRLAIEEQHTARRKETIWQYEPHISVSPVIYGLFHLRKA